MGCLRYPHAPSAPPDSTSPSSALAATTSAVGSISTGPAQWSTPLSRRGVSFFDTADIYGGAGASETLLGEVLAGRRDQVVLATKFGMDMGDGLGPRGSRGYIFQAVENSLRRLRTDVIDYLLVPPARRGDPD